ISQPSSDQGRTQFDLNLKTLGQNEARQAVIGAIKVTAVGVLTAPVSRGDRISFSGKIRPIRNFTNPGGFDYRQYLRFNGIDGSVYIKAHTITVTPDQRRINWMKTVDRARSHIAFLIETVSEGDERGVLKALLIGDKQEISDDLTQQFSRAGLSHLLAISGLHVGIVAGVALWIAIRILSYVPFLLWNARVKKLAAILSIIPVILYGLLAGMSPSTQRAVIMIAIFLLTFLIEREQESFNTIATAAMLILILHPPSLFSISFQLSFVSVLAIVAGMSLIYRKDPDQPKLSLKQKLTSPVLVSLFATAGTFPIVMYYMNQFSLVSPAANFLVVPLMGFGVVPSGLLAICLYPFTVTGAEWILSISRELLHLSLILARFFGDLPFAFATTITPSFLEMGCYYLLLLILYQLATVDHPVTMPGYKKTDNAHFRKSYVAILAVLGIVAVCDVIFAVYQRLYHSDLHVTVLDVGQGNSSLVEFPKGPVMLIDGGGFSDQSAFDVGHRIVAPVLLKKRIQTIDILVLSHPDADHLNGLVYMVKQFHIGEIWATGETSDSDAYRDFREIIQDRQIPLPDFNTLNRDRWINGAAVRILYPPPDALNRMERGLWPDRNNNSMVISVSMGSASVLFPGDV
ncbi:MAG TPA: DNA internalization-related competence protein ComEC/Rec2, partial [Desulfatirhabdiaceae bacterium]|nr:DNA internalization-related competence protein ComEC/Rec2 [Desulfatirhabdiaceae bacterium]